MWCSRAACFMFNLVQGLGGLAADGVSASATGESETMFHVWFQPMRQ
jgi:hypothetical protein